MTLRGYRGEEELLSERCRQPAVGRGFEDDPGVVVPIWKRGLVARLPYFRENIATFVRVQCGKRKIMVFAFFAETVQPAADERMHG